MLLEDKHKNLLSSDGKRSFIFYDKVLMELNGVEETIGYLWKTEKEDGNIKEVFIGKHHLEEMLEERRLVPASEY